VIVALWGLVALLWAAAQVAREQIRWYASWIDLLPAALLVLVVVSAFWAEARRPAINMAGEWAGLLLSYFLIRQLFRDSARQRVLVAAMLGTAVALAAYGIYQTFWGIEATQAEFAKDRLKALQDLGIVPGSPQEESFTNRLNSHEPFATFALANSLAGFLVAWLPLGLAWLIGRFSSSASDSQLPAKRMSASDRGTMTVRLAGAVAMLATVICLFLTQSRTAYVAFLVELALLAILSARRVAGRLREHFSSRTMWCAAATVAVVLAVVLFAGIERGKIDEKLITQATKSFSYRWEYWQATTQLIRDRIWTGTGPGNFRAHYLKYKLPQSSEEINDPHNLVLDVCATSGVVAGLLFALTIAVAVFRMFRFSGTDPPAGSTMDWLALGVGGLGGIGLAAVLSPLSPTVYACLMIAWAGAAAIFANATTRGNLQSSVIACAVVGMTVHLLGAGGIGMPGVAQSLWILLALGLNVAEATRAPRCSTNKFLTRSIMFGWTVALAGFGLLVLRPVTASQSALRLGRNQVRVDDLAGAEGQFRAASRLDPLAAEPWIELSRIQYVRWRGERGRAAELQFAEAVRSLETAIELAPSSLEPHRSLAELLETRAEFDAEFWPRAGQPYRRCVELYPTNATLHAKLANSLWHSGEADAARAEMTRALELDSLTPHGDKKLAPHDRQLIEARLGVE
jgi:tetratricopeptide (TPR) repeat protein